jgi:hypothetical protein
MEPYVTIGDYMRESRPLPTPKRHRDSKFRSVALPALQAAKVDLYCTFLESGLKKAELARRIGFRRPYRTLIFSPAPLPPESDRSGVCRITASPVHHARYAGFRQPHS